MGKAKLSKSLFMLPFVGIISSCGLGNNVSPINKDNAIYNLSDNRVKSKNPVLSEVTIPDEYVLASSDELSQMGLSQSPSLGFLYVRNADSNDGNIQEFGVYSLIFKRLIVPVSYSSFKLNGPTNNGYYIIGQHVSSGLYDVFDYRGYNALSSLTSVDTLTITTSIFNKNLIEYYQINGESVARTVNEDGARSDYIIQNDKELPEVGEIVDTGRSDLKQYGLDGYYAKIGNGYWRVYRNDGSFVAQFQVPSLNAVIFNKTILYQVSTLQADDSSNYDYLSVSSYGDTRKYILRTYTIEILTGKLTEHTVNYLINSSYPPSVVYDKDGIMRYGLVRASDISNKRLMSEFNKLYVLNSDGSIHYDASADPAYGAEILSDTRYYNPTTNEILDENFTSIASLGYSVTARNYDAGLLTVKASTSNSSVYGAVDFDGMAVVSFSYSSLDLSALTNGYGYGKGTDLLDYSINPTTGKEIPHELEAGTYLTPYTGYGHLRKTYEETSESKEKVEYIMNDFSLVKSIEGYSICKLGKSTDIFFDKYLIDSYDYESYSRYIVFHLE